MQISILTWVNRIVYLLTAYFLLAGCFYEYYVKIRYTSSEYFLSGMILLFLLGVFQFRLIIYCYRKFKKVVGKNRKILKSHIKLTIIYICLLIIGSIISYVLHSNKHSLYRDFNDVFSPIFLMGIPFILGGYFTYYLEVLKKELEVEK